jgi:hypothetical protein
VGRRVREGRGLIHFLIKANHRPMMEEFSSIKKTYHYGKGKKEDYD